MLQTSAQRRRRAATPRRTVLAATILAVLAACTPTRSRRPPSHSPGTRSSSRPQAAALNVRAYGALGDGTSDDTYAIQAALNAVPLDGGHVYFPPGLYSVRKTSESHFFTLRAATTLVGAGLSRSTIKVANDNADWVDFLRMATPHSDPRTISVSDLAFDLNTSGNPITASPLTSGRSRYVIRSAGGSGPRISILRCKFVDFSNVNTLYLAEQSVEIRNCQFLGAGRNASIGWDHSTIYAVARRGGSITITDNTFIGTRGSGGSRTAIETHGGRQIVTDNHIADYLTGMNVTGVADGVTQDVRITTNRVYGAMIAFRLWSQPYGDVTTGMEALRVVALRFNTASIDSDAWRQTPEATGAYACGFLLNPHPGTPMSFVTISDNDVRYAKSNAVAAAPLERLACGVTLSGTGEVRNLNINGNRFDGCLSAGLMLDSSVTAVSIFENVFVNPARSRLLPTDPALRSVLFLGGNVTRLTVHDNDAVDDLDGSRLHQVVGAGLGLKIRGSPIRDNVVSRSGRSARIPEVDARLRRLLTG